MSEDSNGQNQNNEPFQWGSEEDTIIPVEAWQSALSKAIDDVESSENLNNSTAVQVEEAQQSEIPLIDDSEVVEVKETQQPKPQMTEEEKAAKKAEYMKKISAHIRGQFEEGQTLKGKLLPADLESKLGPYKDYLSKAGKPFSMSGLMIDLVNHPSFAEGLGVLNRTYLLGESLSKKLQDPSLKKDLSVPLMAVDETPDYKTEDPDLINAHNALKNQSFEIKVMLPSGNSASGEDLDKAKERFWQESYLLSRLNNEYILKVYGFITVYIEGRDVPGFGSVSECIKTDEHGSFTLENLMSRIDEFTPAEVISIIQPMANALRAIHNDEDDEEVYDYDSADTVIHRDVNPRRIMMLEDGRIKLYDFGLAKLLTKDESISIGGKQTSISKSEGEEYFMSPEQARPILSCNLTPPSDLYSLGVVFYMLMAGETPYLANSMTPEIWERLTGSKPDPDDPITSVKYQILERAYNPIADVVDHSKWGSQLISIVKSCMKKKPSERLPATNDDPVRWAARLEYDVIKAAEDCNMTELTVDGKYSGDKARELRQALMVRSR